jgi:hypothetical protein
LGTEYFRETIDPNYWIDLYRDYVQGQLSRAHSIVTDDCRFPNEVDTVIALGGYPVYVSAKEEDRASRLTVRDGKYTPGIQGHKSEDVFTLRFKCRSLIINDGTLEELYAQLDKVYTSVRATSGASPTL